MLRILSRKMSLRHHDSGAKYATAEKVDEGPLLARVYWLSEEDVQERCIWDWCMAHSSMCPPLHRFYGTAMLTKDGLYVQGADMKRKGLGNHHVEIAIAPSQIVDVYRGFDKVFSRWEDRSIGITFKPLRIKFRDASGTIQTWYCMMNFNSLTRSDEGKEWLDRIMQWKKDQRLPVRCYSLPC